MKILQPMSDNLQAFLGPQKKDPSVSYRPTQFHLAVPCEDGVRLFHTLTRELLLLENGETWEQNEDALIAHRFLVPESEDEVASARALRKILRIALRRRFTTHFTILTTTDCNARCFYCFELGRSRVPMSHQVAVDTAAYIARVSGKHEVKIKWFGGEPLFNADAIRTICSGLREAGVPFVSSMATNGFYLNEACAAEAVRDWNLKTVQITLDGTERVYNRTKAYIDGGENAFRTVMDNIAACLHAGIRVSIRLNVNQSNVDDMLSLAETLRDAFGGLPLLGVYPAAIRNFRANASIESQERELQACVSRVEARLREYGLLREGALSNKFRVNHCMADDDGSEVLLPDGRIGKCEHFSESELIGSIYSPERDTAMLEAWKEEATELTECAACALYPTCIRLRKCAWSDFGCSDVERELRTDRLVKQIRAFRA